MCIQDLDIKVLRSLKENIIGLLIRKQLSGMGLKLLFLQGNSKGGNRFTNSEKDCLGLLRPN